MYCLSPCHSTACFSSTTSFDGKLTDVVVFVGLRWSFLHKQRIGPAHWWTTCDVFHILRNMADDVGTCARAALVDRDLCACGQVGHLLQALLQKPSCSGFSGIQKKHSSRDCTQLVATSLRKRSTHLATWWAAPLIPQTFCRGLR